MIASMVNTETKPVWTSSSFLVYTGGLTVLGAAIAARDYLVSQFPGTGQWTAWALLIFVILAAIASALRRADRWLPAGIFAFSGVVMWGILVGATLKWWGWENGSFHNFRIWSWPRLLLEVLILLAATSARWRFKFPFIRLISASVGAYFVIDLATKGEGDPLAVVALLIGLAYLAYGSMSDKPSTFWLHLTAGFLVGIPILYWCHRSTFDFAVVAFVSLVYVIWAYWTKRSSWAVFGTIGFFVVAGFFVAKAVRDSVQASAATFQSPVSGLWFIPLAIGLLGFWLVLLGMLGRRKKRDRQASLVKAETKPAWTAAAFLIYAGGLTVLLGAAVGLVYLGYEDRGYGARTGWALLFLAIIYGLAHALRLRGRWLPAGIFAFVSVLVWATLVLLTMRWIGWHPFNVFGGYYGGSPLGALYPQSPFTSWSWSRMLFWVLVLASASYDRRVFKFPFIRLISAVVFWLFLADLLTSGSGTWYEVLALLTGLAYLLVGNVSDKPSAFWLHVVSAGLISGALLHWFNTGDGDFAVISIFSVLFVLVAYSTKRSVWAVYGTLGFFAATFHYLGLPVHGGPFGLLLSPAESCRGGTGFPTVCTPVGPSISPWAPALAFGLLGFWLVALGMLGERKQGYGPATVVVTTPVPPAEPARA